MPGRRLHREIAICNLAGALLSSAIHICIEHDVWRVLGARCQCLPLSDDLSLLLLDSKMHICIMRGEIRSHSSHVTGTRHSRMTQHRDDETKHGNVYINVKKMCES